jgi:hypothetical protein
MSNLLQTVIPAVLAFVVAYQGGLTRTSRLRSIIRANVQLLDSLPADHPSRATLTAHIEELVGTLVRRQRRRFEPITPAGASFGANVVGTLLMLLVVFAWALQMAGVWVPDPDPEPTARADQWIAMAFYVFLALCFAGFAFKAWRRQQREHPERPHAVVADAGGQ